MRISILQLTFLLLSAVAPAVAQNNHIKSEAWRAGVSKVVITPKQAMLSELQGPNEYAVPVIKVLNSKGDIKAIAFGYAWSRRDCIWIFK